MRFDFSHYEAVTAEQITEIERLVNAETLRNERARVFETTKSEAEALGAIAFFGDKYGDMVRVLEAGPSIELCGGTHVSATGDIGLLKVVSEGSIGSNLRRIEAITGAASVELLQHDEAGSRTSASWSAPPVVTSSSACSASSTRSRRSRTSSSSSAVSSRAARAAEIAAAAVDGVIVARLDGIDPGDLRELAIAVRQQPRHPRVVLDGSDAHGRRRASWRRSRRPKASKRPT